MGFINQLITGGHHPVCAVSIWKISTAILCPHGVYGTLSRACRITLVAEIWGVTGHQQAFGQNFFAHCKANVGTFIRYPGICHDISWYFMIFLGYVMIFHDISWYSWDMSWYFHDISCCHKLVPRLPVPYHLVGTWVPNCRTFFAPPLPGSCEHTTATATATTRNPFDLAHEVYGLLVHLSRRTFTQDLRVNRAQACIYAKYIKKIVYYICISILLVYMYIYIY